MSVQMIAECRLRASKATNSYLRAWVKEIVDADEREPAYSMLKFEHARWTTRKPLENEMDQAIYALAKALILHRQDEFNDTPLSKAVLEFEHAVKTVAWKGERNRNYKRLMIRRRYQGVRA